MNDERYDAVTAGDLQIRGRVVPASNGTYLAEAVTESATIPCIYKPISGERPLWDFPHGTLAGREIAAYLISTALGWDVVPLTVFRDGPMGPGMVQVWCEPDPDADAVDLCPVGQVPAGYLHVLDAQDGAGRDISLVHEDSPPILRMAVFDIVVNNADRKGGHVLAMPDGHRYGVDHGICFHEENKLRTVLWGWAEQPLPEAEAADVALLRRRLGEDDEFRGVLEALLTADEVSALDRRCRALLKRRRMPSPEGHWPAIPWPAF